MTDKRKSGTLKKITDGEVMGTLLTSYSFHSFPDLFTYFKAWKVTDSRGTSYHLVQV